MVRNESPHLSLLDDIVGIGAGKASRFQQVQHFSLAARMSWEEGTEGGLMRREDRRLSLNTRTVTEQLCEKDVTVTKRESCLPNGNQQAANSVQSPARIGDER